MRRIMLLTVSLGVCLTWGGSTARATRAREQTKAVRPQAKTPSLTEDQKKSIVEFLKKQKAPEGGLSPQAVPIAEARRFYASDAYATIAADRGWFVRTGNLYNPDTKHYEWRDGQYGFVQIPLVITADEATGKLDYSDWNRLASAALYVSGKGMATFWLVQSDDGVMRYPVVVANPDNTVDITKAPEPMSLNRELQRKYWSRIHELEPLSDRIPILNSISRDRERLVWALGISTSTLSEKDVSAADESRVYFLGIGYNVNPYVSLILGLTSERTVAAGFSLDAGILTSK